MRRLLGARAHRAPMRRQLFAGGSLGASMRAGASGNPAGWAERARLARRTAVSRAAIGVEPLRVDRRTRVTRRECQPRHPRETVGTRCRIAVAENFPRMSGEHQAARPTSGRRGARRSH